VFDYLKNKRNIVFILPKKWKSTKGTKVTVYPKEREEFKLITTSAPFYHSRYPIIRGHLKGWMPFLGGILRTEAKPGDILCSFYEPNLLVTYLYSRLAKKLGLKHIFFSWQNVPYEKRLKGVKFKITDWFLKENFRLSAGGLFGMNKATEIHGSYLQINPELKTAVIPQTGIDTDLFKPGIGGEIRKKYGFENEVLFVYAATFTQRKGTIPTIEAFGQIARENPRIRLLMIGTGELADEVKRTISELNLDDKITLLPWQPVNQLAPIFSAADVFIHPSQPYQGWEEQFGLLILQAQACGAPVIATSIGSLEESVLDQKTGILVEPGNVEQIAEAMKKLAIDHDLRKKMGLAARNYIVSHFSNQSVAERLDNFFENL